jgi:hypothetical protein
MSTGLGSSFNPSIQTTVQILFGTADPQVVLAVEKACNLVKGISALWSLEKICLNDGSVHVEFKINGKEFVVITGI